MWYWYSFDWNKAIKINYSEVLTLETEYSRLFGQYHACKCPGSLSHQGISSYGIDSIG